MVKFYPKKFYERAYKIQFCEKISVDLVNTRKERSFVNT